MKKKISRILGVALTLMLLTSLMVGFAVAPAGAAEGKWNGFGLPAAGGAGGFVHLSTFGTAAGNIITQGIDGTLWAYRDDGVTNTPSLYKSTDSGRSWARKGNSPLMDDLALVDIVCSSKDADTAWVATITTIYVTTNGGTSFTAMVTNGLANFAGGVFITSIDVGYVGETAYVFMATASLAAIPPLFGGLYVLGPAYGANWTDLQVAEVNNTVAPAESQVDVYDVAVMPDFSTGQGLVAVVQANAAQVYVVTKYAGANWGANVGRATLTGCTAVLASAQIAFPANFSSVTTSGLMEYFVGVDVNDTGDVFRVVQANALDRNIAGAATLSDVTGLDVKGDVGSAHIIAGRSDNTPTGTWGTYYSADNGATWTKSKKGPSGATWLPSIVMDQDFLTNTTAWAGTQGNEGGVYRTVDALEWNGVGLLNTDINLINDFAVGAGSSETVFVAVQDTGTDDMVWRHDGTNWELIYTDQLGLDALMIAVTDTFSADTTVFLADTGALRIARSTDGGDRWGNQLTVVPAAFGITPEAWLIQSPTEMLVGNNALDGKIYQTTNNGTTWNARACGIGSASIASIAKSPEYATDSTVVAGTTAGFVTRSVNSGTNWAQIPAGAAALGGAGNTFVTFNGADAEQVFAVTTGVGNSFVYRYNFGATAWTGNIVVGNAPAPGGPTVTSVWEASLAVPAASQFTVASVGVVSSPDGALYVAEVGAGRAAGRCVNPEKALTPLGAAPFFEYLNPAGCGFPAAAVTAVGPIYTPGSNKVWVADSRAGVANKLYYYHDACVEGPTGLKASVGQTGANLVWAALDGASRYIVHYNRADLAWSGATQQDSTTTGFNTATVAALASGTEYHFRVCVHEATPALSRWSSVVTFTTKMGAAAWSPFPTAGNFFPSPGATDVDPIQTLFQWNPSAGAEGYEFQLSDNAAFAGADAKKIKAPAYQWPGDLDYGKTYYWRVRAYKAGTASEWATAIFTTAEEPVAPTPPVVVQPSPPPPTPTVIPTAIPDYLLVTIIVIGAVLVIALIVLIVKTRRVA